MKYYKCDMCGRIATSARFKEENWETIYFDVNGEEVIWTYDKDLRYFYADAPIATTHHYCPLCYEVYHDFYYPFIPRKS